MIVKQLEDLIGTERDIRTPNWSSRRLLLKKDGMGFSFHETIIKAGTETLIWYKNHLEAVYCVTGEGELETVKDNKIFKIKPGTMYALNENDKHKLRGITEMRLVCVFSPALTGDEVHDDHGVYPLIEERV